MNYYLLYDGGIVDDRYLLPRLARGVPCAGDSDGFTTVWPSSVSRRNAEAFRKLPRGAYLTTHPLTPLGAESPIWDREPFSGAPHLG